MTNEPITSPNHPAMASLCGELASRADDLDAAGDWPGEQLRLCADYGVFQWFLPKRWGGQDRDARAIVEGYLHLSAACLTTTFIITQRTGACRRIAASHNDAVKHDLLPGLASGERFATLGISHLTTSRRHLSRPVLAAREVDGGFRLDGFSPWVTGGAHAEHVVIGATLPDGREIVLAMPTDLPGVEAGEHARLVGLTSSHTGATYCHDVFVDRRWLLAGPVENVMSSGGGGATGGLQTSTLAVGLASAAIDYLNGEAARRDGLREAAERLVQEYRQIHGDLLALAGGDEVCTLPEVRTRANSLVLRATQAALAAAKGSGYAAGHPVGRWCREALFFLVWSCPQEVLEANLCELAGV